MRRRLSAAAVACLITAGGAAHADPDVRIATGDEQGVYHVIGQAICAHLDRTVANCSAESSAGSAANIERLRAEEVDFALVQADLQFAAATGLPPFKEAGRFEGLSSVASFHAEAFTIIAPERTEIRRFTDLRDKRVNADEPGSGTRRTFDFLLDWKEWTTSDFSTVAEFPPSAIEQMLCGGRVDASVYVVGHPNRAVREAIDDCPITFVPFGEEEIRTLTVAFPYFIPVVIPAGTYPAVPEDVPTFGVPATLLTRADVSDARVRAVLGAIYDNLDELRRGHAALAGLDPERMHSAGLYAPLHPAAKAFYLDRDR